MATTFAGVPWPFFRLTPCSKPTPGLFHGWAPRNLEGGTQYYGVQGAQGEIEDFRKTGHVLFFPPEPTSKKNGSLTGTVLSRVLEMRVDAAKKIV